MINMNFIVKNGPFIKDKNNVAKINLSIISTLIPFIIYKIFLNGINSIILFAISIISTLFISVFYDYIIGKKIIIDKYYKDLIFGIIVGFIIPINTPYIILFFTNIIITFISKYYKQINIYIIASTIITWFIIISGGKLIFLEYNIYIFSLLIFMVLLFLISMKTIKFRIVIGLILFIIINILLKQNITEIDYILIFSSIFVIPNFDSTPNSALIQFIFGLSIGIISIFINLEILFIIIIILNLIFKYLDRYYSYYLVRD